MPPAADHIRIYFDQQGFTAAEAIAFEQHHDQQGWKSRRGQPLRNWKTAAAQWIWALKLQRPYLRFK